MTILESFQETYRKSPNKTAVIFKDTHYSYQYIFEESKKISSNIIAESDKKDIISLLLPNGIDFIISYLGVLQSGRICHIVSPSISDESMKYQINHVQSSFILSNSAYSKKLSRTDMLDSKKFFNIDLKFKLLNFEKQYFENSNIASIIFTSGTTSIPKAIQISHGNIINTTNRMINFLKITNSDIDLNSLPLSHSFGLGCLHCILAKGGTVVLHRNMINLKDILNSIKKYSCTTFANVPTTFQLLLDNFRTEFLESISSIRYILTNSAPMPNSLIKDMLSLLKNKKLFTYYGLTEASRCTFHLYNDDISKIGSVGKPLPGIKIKISNKDIACKSFEHGEIFVFGTNVTPGYLGNSNLNKKIQNGWLQTGDMGYFDDEGFLYIIGRTDDILNIGGEKVSPLEIEKILNEFDKIKESVVKGSYNRLLGTIPKAYIVTKNNEKIQELEIINYCKTKLESYKIPRIYEFVEHIPKNEQGKILRKMV